MNYRSTVDHLIYAAPGLNRGIDEIERLVGIRAALGGQHQGLGTRNALIPLGPRTYLEVFAPDPEQPVPEQPRPFGLDGLTESRLAAWFIGCADLERLRDDAVRSGVPFGEVKAGSRRRPDGVVLAWRFTDPWRPVADGIVPFLIDWGESPHPAEAGPVGAALVGLRAEHPDEQSVRRMLQVLDLDLPVERGQRPALIATLEGPRGRVELR